MMTEKEILGRLKEAVGESAGRFYTEDQLNRFAAFYLDKWDENTSEDIVAEALIDFHWDKVKTRRCSVCGQLTEHGYNFVSQSDEIDLIYCSRKCLHEDFKCPSDWEQYCKRTQSDHTF